jgi:vitamin B12 transporter
MHSSKNSRTRGGPALPLCLAALLLSGLAALAEEPEEKEAEARRLTETVVVTATLSPETPDEAPAASTALEGEELREQGLVSVEEALRRVPGASVVRSGNPGKVSSFFVRGANSNQVLVLYDGIELNTPFFGGYDLSHLSLSDVERVEVVRGPFSALHGSQAIGGVVNVISRRPYQEGVSGAVRLQGGTEDYRMGDLSVQAATGRFLISASLDRVETAGLEGETVRFHSGAVPVANDDYRRDTGSARASYGLPGGSEIAFQIRRSDAELSVPYSGGVATPDARQTVEERVWALPLDLRLGRGGDLRLQVAQVDQAFSFSDPEAPFSAQETEARSQSYRADYFAPEWRGHGFVAGFQRQDQRVDNETDHDGSQVTNLNDERVRMDSLFVQDAWRLHEKLRLVLGLRWDDYSSYGSRTSPRVSVNYDLVPGLTLLRASWGQAFRAPTPGELYYPYTGNTDLRPEASTGYEAGLVQYLARERVRLEGTLFYTELEDLISFDTASFRNENIGRARTRGLELGLAARVTGAWTLGGDYTWLRAEDLDAAPEQRDLLRRPESQLRLYADWKADFGLDLHLETRYVGARADVDPVTFERATNPSYSVVDLSGIYDLSRHLAIQARLGNLLDEEFQEALGFPALGRHATIGLVARFGG